MGDCFTIEGKGCFTIEGRDCFDISTTIKQLPEVCDFLCNWTTTNSTVKFTFATTGRLIVNGEVVSSDRDINVETNVVVQSCPKDSLTLFYCDNNQLSGEIPSLPSSLESFYCYNNQLSGEIPPLPSSLNALSCSGNQLSGEIPPLPNSLSRLYCDNNQLSGEIPPLPSSLRIIRLADNQLSGEIPSLPSSLENLSCSYNQLSGEIPLLPSLLRTFYCSNNQLSGVAATSADSLIYINVERNNLSTSDVDKLLQILVNNGLHDGYANFQYNSPPSSQDNVNILKDRGWTIATD